MTKLIAVALLCPFVVECEENHYAVSHGQIDGSATIGVL